MKQYFVQEGDKRATLRQRRGRETIGNNYAFKFERLLIKELEQEEVLYYCTKELIH